MEDLISGIMIGGWLSLVSIAFVMILDWNREIQFQQEVSDE